MTEDTDGTPLGGELSVVDLSVGIAGAYLGKLLVDAGAEVIKIEAPGGDPLRRRRVVGAPVPAVDRGGPLFRFLAASKSSVVADPSSLLDVEHVVRLVRGADAVIWSSISPFAECDALQPRSLRRAAPRAIVTALGLVNEPSAPANEFTLQAMSGGGVSRGRADREPLAAGGAFGDWITGLFGAVGLLTAHIRSQETGIGELVDVSGLDGLHLTQNMFFPTFFAASGRPMRTVRIRSIPLIHPTTDGYVGFQITTGQQWQDFAAMIGRPDWAEDPSLTRFDARIARFDEVNSTVDAWTSQRTTREVTELGALFRLPVAPVANGQTVPQIDQVVQRSWMVEHPGGFIAPDVPYTFQGGAKKRTVGSPPSLGHDTERFRSHPNPAKDEEPTGRPRPLPFEGIRIVDFTAYWAGPIISHFFAMMGADVIHVESIKRPDGIRAATLKFDMSAGWWEASPAFAGTNTNKRDLTLDMTTEAGRGLARRLVAHCDVVLDNYSTRVMPQWGLDPDTLRTIKPDLIVVRAPGFGLTGPWADRVAYATTIEQASGAAWMTGFADDRPDVTGGAMDPVAGTHAAFALLLALEHRRRTGNGLVLEVPQFTSGINVCAEQIIEYSASNVLLGRIGNRSWVAAPQGTYRVLDQERSVEGLPADEWIALSVENDEQWLSLCQLLGREDLRTDASLRSVVGRQASHDLIDQAIHNWTRTRRGNDVVELAASAGIPCALWEQTDQLVAIPQVVARQLYEQVDNPGLGLVPIVGYPAQFEQGPRRVHRRRAPLLGEHNDEILGGLLGLSDEEIAALEGNEVIGSQASSMSAW